MWTQSKMHCFPPEETSQRRFLFAMSPSHHLTISPSHRHITISPSHHLIISPSHLLTISPSHHHLSFSLSPTLFSTNSRVGENSWRLDRFMWEKMCQSVLGTLVCVSCNFRQQLQRGLITVYRRRHLWTVDRHWQLPAGISPFLRCALRVVRTCEQASRPLFNCTSNADASSQGPQPLLW